MPANSRLTNTAYDFNLAVCELSPSKRPDVVVDIRNFVVEINIYESLNKPYLSGDIVISDTIGLYTQLDIKGIDRLKIGVKLPDEDAETIERTFYIDSVVSSTRTNDNESVYVFHLIEEIAFLSNNIMVNDVFEGGFGADGTGTQMIKDLFNRYFGRQIVINGDGGEARGSPIARFGEITQPKRYIAPFVTPLSVANTILNIMVDEKSTPYFLYSSLVGENVYLQSFADMLYFNSRYKGSFRYSQAVGQGDRNSLGLDAQQYSIESYTDTETLDITRINNDGFVNSLFYFYDIVRGLPYNPHHSDPTVTFGSIGSIIDDDDNRPPYPEARHWTAYGMFNSPSIAELQGGSTTGSVGDEAVKHLYPENAVLPWQTPDGRTNPQFNQEEVNTALNGPQGGNIEALHKRPASRMIINMLSAAGWQEYSSYNEYPSDAAQSAYLALVDATALRKWITSDPIEFVVPGRLFISRSVNDDTYNTTIGRIADLQFTTIEGNTIIPDLKKSGNHLLYAARHMFSIEEGYKVQFTGVKVTPPSDTSVARDFAPEASQPDTPEGVLT